MKFISILCSLILARPAFAIELLPFDWQEGSIQKPSVSYVSYRFELKDMAQVSENSFRGTRRNCSGGCGSVSLIVKYAVSIPNVQLNKTFFLTKEISLWIDYGDIHDTTVVPDDLLPMGPTHSTMLFAVAKDSMPLVNSLGDVATGNLIVQFDKCFKSAFRGLYNSDSFEIYSSDLHRVLVPCP